MKIPSDIQLLGVPIKLDIAIYAPFTGYIFQLILQI
jgi:hypothetical protein